MPNTGTRILRVEPYRGVIIGTGIFVLTGEAAGLKAGPAVLR